MVVKPGRNWRVIVVLEGVWGLSSFLGKDQDMLYGQRL
jgi:hypothetical protein